MLVINTEKSFVMHVRGRKRSTEQLNLYIAGKPLKQVAEFKYLGFYFNEQLSLNQSSDRIARNASSSFGNFRQKLSDLPNNCPFKIAEKMFHATVTSVGEYASEICGANPKLSQIHLRFVRSFFGLRTNTPDDAIYYLTAYFPAHFGQIRRHLKFLKRIALQPCDRLLHKALIQAITTGKSRKISLLRKSLAKLSGLIGFEWSMPVDRILQIFVNMQPNKIINTLESNFRSELSSRILENHLRHGRLFFLQETLASASRFVFLDSLLPYLEAATIKILTFGHHLGIETGRSNRTPQK